MKIASRYASLIKPFINNQLFRSYTGANLAITQNISVPTVETEIFHLTFQNNVPRFDQAYAFVVENTIPATQCDITFCLYLNDVVLTEQPRTFLANEEVVKQICFQNIIAFNKGDTLRLTVFAENPNQIVLTNCSKAIFNTILASTTFVGIGVIVGIILSELISPPSEQPEPRLVFLDDIF